MTSDRRMYGISKEQWPIPMVKCSFLDNDFMPIKAGWNDEVCLAHIGNPVVPLHSADKGGVYLIKIKDTDLHKIGVANDAKKRLAALQTSNPFELELVSCYQVEGPYDHEKRLHRHFQEFRTQGEWFKMGALHVHEFREYFA